VYTTDDSYNNEYIIVWKDKRVYQKV
jgi:hypothetical protein